MLADVDHAYNQLVSAISSFDVSRNRVVELQEFIVEFRQGEYSHELSEELNQLELSLIETQTKLDA